MPSRTVAAALRVEAVGETAIIRFPGEKVTLNEEALSVFGPQLTGLIDGAGRREWVLDFENVDYLTSTTLGALLRLNCKAKEAGGRLRLENLAPHLREVFAVTRLDRV